MYDREYNGQTINFEASGGLIHSSLVMQDAETDSYWAIMSGESIAGEFKGTKLRELAIGEKMKWQDWLARHPDTSVLSVQGKEQGTDNYASYFRDSSGFRGARARDKRLKTKEPIFAFRYEGKSFAARHSDFEDGKVYKLGETELFLYRPKGAKMFESTTAILSTSGGFHQQDGNWIHGEDGCTFEISRGEFAGENGSCAERLAGFDTFWYNWSLANSDTELLQ